MKQVPTSMPANSVLFINKLRVLGAFAIVVAHTAGGTADSQTPLSGPWWLCIAIYFFGGFWAIPTFVMISGALLLDVKPQESAWTFYKRRVYRLAVPIFFWTAFYLGLRVWRDHEALGLQEIITSVLSGRPYAHLWYLYMIPGLYLVTPALRQFIRVTSRTQRIAVIILLMVAADAYHLANVTFWGNPSSVFFMFIPFISYYLLGNELFCHRPRLNTAVLIGLVLLTLGYLAVLARPFMTLKGQQFDTFYLSFFGPPVALVATLIFGISARQNRDKASTTWLDKFFARLAPTTLGIYVIHIVLLEILGDVAGDSSEDASLALGLIAGPIIAFCLSGAITALIQKLPYFRRIVG
jgi:surface polysaccharide O-acyltransferase-like enzyme